MDVTLPLVLSTGILDSLNPCAISLLLIYIALLFTLGKTRKEIMGFGVFYIAAVYVTYFLLGIGLLKTFVFFGTPNIILRGGAILAIIFGILNIKEYFWPDLPPHIKMPYSVRQKANDIAYKATIPAAITLGVLIGITEFPCSGAVYITILSYLQAKETFASGIFYLALYNLMFVLPLIVIYLVATNRVVVEKIINKQEQFGRKMHLVLAGLMIILGAAILLWFS
ncbi:MAG: cytochrome c biogenesis protein CcdA [Patescibacteria group bacterium]|nr:cytochrome c biogenesis protein CcdA [Patescibacteria group bacterium]